MLLSSKWSPIWAQKFWILSTSYPIQLYWAEQWVDVIVPEKRRDKANGTIFETSVQFIPVHGTSEVHKVDETNIVRGITICS